MSGDVVSVAYLQVLRDECRVVAQPVQQHHRQDSLLFGFDKHIVFEVVFVVLGVLAGNSVLGVELAINLEELVPFLKLVNLLLAQTFRQLQSRSDFLDSEDLRLVHHLHSLGDILEVMVRPQ